MLDSTMAISIEATPEDAWPWLVQMGDPPREGILLNATQLLWRCRDRNRLPFPPSK
jgi:hypothetical protein